MQAVSTTCDEAGNGWRVHFVSWQSISCVFFSPWWVTGLLVLYKRGCRQKIMPLGVLSRHRWWSLTLIDIYICLILHCFCIQVPKYISKNQNDHLKLHAILSNRIAVNLILALMEKLFQHFNIARPFSQCFPQTMALMNRTINAVLYNKNGQHIFCSWLVPYFPALLPLTVARHSWQVMSRVLSCPTHDGLNQRHSPSVFVHQKKNGKKQYFAVRLWHIRFCR